MARSRAVRRNWFTMVSLVIVAVTWAAVRIVPAWHDRVRAARLPELHAIDLTSLAARHPRDAQAQLAACWAPSMAGENAAGRDRAYARAASLLPTSPAPHLLYAGALMASMRLHRREMEPPYPPSQHSVSETALTPKERRRSAEAERALQRAGDLDPQNAAVEYLRAYLALAGHRDAEALDDLKRALAKPQWDLYERESNQAKFGFLQRVWPRAEAADYALGWAAAPITLSVDLARALADMSALAAQEGRHDRAVFLRDSLDHLASLTLAHAYDLGDATVAQIVALSAIAGPLPATEKEETTGPEALASYLTEHGRPDLAQRARLRRENVARVFAELRARRKLPDAQDSRDMAARTVLTHVVWARDGTLLLVLLGGLAALALTALSRPVTPIRWPTWGWASVMTMCLLVTFGVGVVWRGEALSPGVAAAVHMLRDLGRNLGVAVPIRINLSSRPWGLYYALIFLPLLLLAVLAVVLLHRRRHAGGERPGFGGHYVGTALRLLLPLCALLSLATCALVIPTARRAAARERKGQRLIEQGGVAYFHVGGILAQLEQPGGE